MNYCRSPQFLLSRLPHEFCQFFIDSDNNYRKTIPVNISNGYAILLGWPFNNKLENDATYECRAGIFHSPGHSLAEDLNRYSISDCFMFLYELCPIKSGFVLDEKMFSS